MEQKSNKELIEMYYRCWVEGKGGESTDVLVTILRNLNDKQEAAEKYIKSKYPKVYKEVYGTKENSTS